MLIALIAVSAACLIEATVIVAQHRGSAAAIAAAESQAEQARSAADAVGSTADVVHEAVAVALADSELVANVTGADRGKWLCEGPNYDEAACVAFLLCAQVAGGTVQPSACDAAANQWVSEARLEAVEADAADEKRRDERRRLFEARK